MSGKDVFEKFGLEKSCQQELQWYKNQVNKLAIRIIQLTSHGSHDVRRQAESLYRSMQRLKILE